VCVMCSVCDCAHTWARATNLTPRQRMGSQMWLRGVGHVVAQEEGVMAKEDSWPRRRPHLNVELCDHHGQKHV
jgi:hypothetical protein